MKEILMNLTFMDMGAGYFVPSLLLLPPPQNPAMVVLWKLFEWPPLFCVVIPFYQIKMATKEE